MADKDLQNCVTFVKYQQNPLETEFDNKKSLLNLTGCVMIYNLAWTILTLPTFLPFFLVSMIIFWKLPTQSNKKSLTSS